MCTLDSRLRGNDIKTDFCMRYIILFIIAILLPILAFFNFTQTDEVGEVSLTDQVASISFAATEDSESSEPPSTDSENLVGPDQVQEVTDFFLDEVFGGAATEGEGEEPAQSLESIEAGPPQSEGLGGEPTDKGPQYKIPKAVFYPHLTGLP